MKRENNDGQVIPARCYCYTFANDIYILECTKQKQQKGLYANIGPFVVNY